MKGITSRCLGIAFGTVVTSAAIVTSNIRPAECKEEVLHASQVPSPKVDEKKPQGIHYWNSEPVLRSVAWDNNWDRRGSGDVSKTKESGPVRSIYMIRHGQYMKADDDADRHLTDLGKKQAASVGERLANLPFSFDEIYVSNMTRALETCGIIYDEYNKRQDSIRKEQKKLHPWPAKKVSSMLREGAPEKPLTSGSRWRPSDSDFFRDGARIEASYRQFFHRPSADDPLQTNILLVCHANVIRYFVLRAVQFPPELWSKFSLVNCSVTRVDIYADGRVQLRGVGDAGHHTSEMLTTS
eukprot:CFRG4959T1